MAFLSVVMTLSVCRLTCYCSVRLPCGVWVERTLKNPLVTKTCPNSANQPSQTLLISPALSTSTIFPQMKLVEPGPGTLRSGENQGLMNSFQAPQVAKMNAPDTKTCVPVTRVQLWIMSRGYREGRAVEVTKANVVSWPGDIGYNLGDKP